MNKYKIELKKVGTFDYDGLEALTTTEDIMDLIDEYGLKDQKEEHIVVLTVDNDVQATGIFDYVNGETGLDNYKIIASVLANNCTDFILMHNYPEGTSEPTDADVINTKRLYDFCEQAGLMFYDHVIVDKEGNYFSMRKEGFFKYFEEHDIEDLKEKSTQ